MRRANAHITCSLQHTPITYVHTPNHLFFTDSSLRPGWSASDLLTPERFESLLTTIKDTPSVVLCIVDIFDLRGSILTNLRNIVGNNPIVIAANKVDLLPVDVSLLRVQSWIHSEIKQICGYRSPRDEEESNEYFVGNEEREKESGEEDDMYFGKGHFATCYLYCDILVCMRLGL